MTIQIRNPHNADAGDSDWLHSLEFLALGLLYVTAFWGQAARLLPAPLDQWHSLAYRAVGPWMHEHMPAAMSPGEQRALYQLGEAGLLGVLLPIWILRRHGYGLREAGVLAPGRPAVRLGIASALLSLPVGLYLGHIVPDPWGTPLQEGLELLTVVPEHFLIFGVFGALLLPSGHASADGSVRRLGAREIFAIATTSITFFLVHIGVAHSAALIASFPLGLIFAYVTVRSANIFPAIAAHWIMNVVPMGWDTLRT